LWRRRWTRGLGASKKKPERKAVCIVAVLSASLLVLVLLLLIPVDVDFRVAREERSRSDLSVGWMFGLLRKEIEVGPRSRRQGPNPRRPETDGKRTRSKRAAAHLAILARTRGFPYRCLRLIRELLLQAKIRELRLRGRLGLNEPADTGLLFAALTPALCYLSASPSVSVSLEPDFQEVSLTGQANGAFRIVPMQVMWILVLFLLSPETLRAAWSLARRRRR
jgi:hypothetical protein